jgi:hypothetical protein
LLDTTGSPAAVFEAAEHLCRAAAGNCSARIEARLQKASFQIDAASALIKGNSFLIQTHGYSRGSCRRLENIRDLLCGKIKPEPPSALIASKINRLQRDCTEVMRAIAREVGEDGKAYQRHRELRALVAGKSVSKLNDTDSGDLAQVLREQTNGTGLREWIRWWRWSAMLAIASRSFAMAELNLRKALFFFMKREVRYPVTESFEMAAINHDELSNMVKDVSLGADLRIEVLRVLEQLVALLVWRQSAAKRLARFQKNGGGTDSANGEVRDQAERFSSIGLRLADAIAAADHSSDLHHVMQAMWCKSRLLMHQSRLVSSFPDFEQQESAYDPSISLLGDAEACLRISDRRRYRADLAMVELHRADVRLRQSEAVKIKCKNGDIPFLNFCDQLLKEDISLEPLTTMEPLEGSGEVVNALLRRQRVLRHKYFDDPDKVAQSPAIRQIKALANDAMRFLDRAEPALRERRRNVWWTTWFFERRLRIIASLLWASVLETSTPIPYLGLESAMRKTATEPDRLLEDAVRMIRVDEYRLATIILAYSSCVRALQVRLLWDPSCVPLPDRLGRMYRNLRYALKELREVHQRRERAVADKNKDRPDKSIRNFVQNVQIRSQRLLESLRS